jgi:transposase
MSFYLVAGQAVSTDTTRASAHLPTARPRHYPSDTTDAEWALLAGHVPVGGAGGRPVTYPRRDVVDAIRYLAHNGCVWRALPADFPPRALVYHYFTTWTRDGTLNRIHNSLREQARHAEGRNPQPTAAIIDSQSLRAAETVPATSRGYDAGKKINGRKRHIAVDTGGLLLAVAVTAASVQDRVAARQLLWAVHTCYQHVSMIWADSGYTGTLIDYATTCLGITVQIVAKLAHQHTFVVHQRRWVVERSFSWINRCRRTVRDYERRPDHHAAYVQWAMIIIMTRRLTRHHT